MRRHTEPKVPADQNVLPFVVVASERQRSGPLYCVDADRKRAPCSVHPYNLLSLGCCIEMRSCAVDAGATQLHYFALKQNELAGGRPLRSMRLSWDMFGADAMRVANIGLHLS